MPQPTGLDAVIDAVETGAGLPQVVRAAAQALDASLAVTAVSGAVLAVAARSPSEERVLLVQREDVVEVPLRVGDGPVGVLHVRGKRERDPVLLRLLTTIIASETQRTHAPDRARQHAVGQLFAELLGKKLVSREQILERAAALSLDLGKGASVVVARAAPQSPTEDGWRLRVREVAERGARAAVSDAHAALSDREDGGIAEALILLPGADEQLAAKAAKAVLSELQAALSGCVLTLGRSRFAADPAEIRRAIGEALLAANVADGGSDSDSEDKVLAFEDTGSYRLLLSGVSDNPRELRRFYEETVAPLLAYDEQYETDLLLTLEAFLDADGNVARASQRLYTHRHTVYYRLERIKELTGLDVSSTDGREKLSLGLKSMRVLGLHSRGGPATEVGAAGGRVAGARGAGV